MLLSQELSAEGTTEMVGKRFTEVSRTEAGPTGLEAELVNGTGPEEEVGPVELEVGLVRPQPTWQIHPIHLSRHVPCTWQIYSASTQAYTYPSSGARTGQPPPSSDRRLFFPSSEEGFRRSLRPPAAAAAAASSMSPSSNRRAL
jgi:hypothetical protein